MSSDEAYSSFLDQANQDTGSDNAKAQAQAEKGGEGKGGQGGQGQLRTANTAVPAGLKSMDAYYYESEVDERFEGVALQWEGEGEIDENKFAKLVGHTSSVETLSTKSFDPRGKYKDVIRAVEQEIDGKVKVFRIETDRSRVVYYIVGVQESSGQQKKVVGVRANAVES